MRKEYGKALREIFQKTLAERFPEFLPAKVSSPFFFPGNRAFERKVPSRISLWIVLNPSPKDYENFTVLIGWSRKCRWPELSMVPCLVPPFPREASFALDEYLTRLPALWTTEDKWWDIEPFQFPTSLAEQMAALQKRLQPISPAEAAAKVAPVVGETVAALETYGVPFLDDMMKTVAL